MSLNTPAHIHIVDDDASVRTSLARLLSLQGYTIQTHDSAETFLQQLDPEPVKKGLACLILDIRMPGMTGMELQETLHKRLCPLPIIFITGHGDIPMSVRAIKGGAVDFLSKPFRHEELFKAVDQALAHAKEHLSETRDQQDIQARYDSLTPREKQVLTGILAGQLNKQIAADLGITIKTIKVHRAAVLSKMQIRGLPELGRLMDKVKKDPGL